MDEHPKRGPEVPADAAAEGESLTRRSALKVIAAGAAGAAALPAAGCVPPEPVLESLEEAGQPGAPGAEPRAAPQQVGNPLAAGTPSDPDLISPAVPWDGILSEEELRTVAALCDVIIPEDEGSPNASAVGAHEFVNEWVSAPYEGNQTDLVLVRGGITWLNVEAGSRFGREFADLALAEKQAICDDIAYRPRALPEHRAAARFFDKIRDLTATAFYTTQEGMADLGYVGNLPMSRFDGPPREVLERLGLI
jgi:hypothetical protein